MFRLALSASLFVAPAHAQTLTVSELVLGQTAQLSVSGAPSGATIAWLVSFGGPGVGPCVNVATCLDLLPPYVLLAVLPANGAGGSSLAGPVPSAAPLVPIGFQCLVAPGSGTLGKTNAVATAIHPLSHFDDEFEGATLDSSWSVLHPELASITVSGGRLDLVPNTGGLPNMWFQGGEGVHVRRTITGDFTVTTRLTVDDPSNPGAPPPPSYRFAGISARDPSSTALDQDYVHAAIGVGGPFEPIVSEDKSNLDSVSDWLVYPIASNTGELRITRAGSSFSIYYRLDSQSAWTLMRTHDRPDLPATLEVGPMAYAASSPAAVRGRFDYVRFE